MVKLGWNYGMEGLTISGSFCLIGSFLNMAFGGWDQLLHALCIMMSADFIVGFLAAAKAGKVDSKVMFWGGVNKILVMVLVAVGTVLDGVLAAPDPYIRTAIIWFYIGREGLSLIENYGRMGHQLPEVLTKLLAQIQVKK